MQCRTLFIAVSLLYVVTSSVLAADECASSVATSPTVRLKQKLLCNYDSELRPVKHHTNTTLVTYNLYVSAFVFHEDINVLEVRSWVNLEWKDEHLVWTKSDFEGTENLAMRCSRLWVPDVGLTSGPDISVPDASASHCLVFNNGKVQLGLPIVHLAECVPDVTRWPFDTHNCTMEVGSWAFFENEINIAFSSNGVSPSTSQDNRDWVQVSGSVERKVEDFESLNQTWPFLEYSFVLQRHPGGAAATVFVPAIVLATMTLVTFWMEPGHPERLRLVHLNILCHCMYMIYLGMKLPGNGDKTPLIITFFRDSFLLAGVSLLVALCAGRMITTARAPPTFITSFTDKVVATYPGQILLFGENDAKSPAAVLNADGKYEGLTLVEASVMRSWRVFAVILDRLCFLTFTVSLFILLSGFIPKNL